MKKNLILVFAMALTLVLASSTVVMADPGPDVKTREWYLESQPNPDVFHELERGNTVFYVTSPTAVIDGDLVSDVQKVYKGQVLPAGTIFRVNGISAMYEDYRWVRGWYGKMSVGGKSWLFPADHLSFEFLDPNTPGPKDCTGHPLSVPWYMTGKINWDIRLPKDADKMEVYLAEDYPLIDAKIFAADQVRRCLVTLKKDTMVSLRGLLSDNDWPNSSGTRWTRVRLPGGMEGLLPTGKLSPTPLLEKKPAVVTRPTPGLYVVQSGDSLWSISQKLDLDFFELIKINSRSNAKIRSNPGLIKPGWKIILPILPTR